MAQAIDAVINPFAMAILENRGGVEFAFLKHFLGPVGELPAEISVNVTPRVDPQTEANNGKGEAFHDTREVMSGKLLCVVHEQSILVQVHNFLAIWMACLHSELCKGPCDRQVLYQQVCSERIQRMRYHFVQACEGARLCVQTHDGDVLV